MIIKQREEISEFIEHIKYELKFIDKKKLIKIKKLCNQSTERFHLPIDIAVYNDMMNIQIKKILSTMDKSHKELKIQPSSGYFNASEAMGWIEMSLILLHKELKSSFFIDYRKYRHQAKKDTSGIIADNYQLVFRLQKKKLEMNQKFIISTYRVLPKLLQTLRGE